MNEAAALVCIFAYQSGFVANVPLSDVHLFREPVIVPCHWTYEQARAFWWAQYDEDHPAIPLPPEVRK